MTMTTRERLEAELANVSKRLDAVRAQSSALYARLAILQDALHDDATDLPLCGQCTMPTAGRADETGEDICEDCAGM